MFIQLMLLQLIVGSVVCCSNRVSLRLYVDSVVCCFSCILLQCKSKGTSGYWCKEGIGCWTGQVDFKMKECFEGIRFIFTFDTTHDS